MSMSMVLLHLAARSQNQTLKRGREAEKIYLAMYIRARLSRHPVGSYRDTPFLADGTLPVHIFIQLITWLQCHGGNRILHLHPYSLALSQCK